MQKVKCNHCEWSGEEKDLIIKNEEEFCPNCGKKDALMDIYKNMDAKMKLMFEAENEILDIVDHADEFTRGDLQGALEAQLMILINKIERSVKYEKC